MWRDKYNPSSYESKDLSYTSVFDLKSFERGEGIFFCPYCGNGNGNGGGIGIGDQKQQGLQFVSVDVPDIDFGGMLARGLLKPWWGAGVRGLGLLAWGW